MSSLLKNAWLSGADGRLLAGGTLTLKSTSTLSADSGATVNLANATVTLPTWVPIQDTVITRSDGDLMTWDATALKWRPIHLVAGTNVTIVRSSSTITVNSSGGGGGGGGSGINVVGLARFSATGGTISGLVASGVITSVGRTGAGLYTVSFGTSVSDYTVAISATSDGAAVTVGFVNGSTAGTSSVDIGTLGLPNTLRDPNVVMVSIIQ